VEQIRLSDPARTLPNAEIYLAVLSGISSPAWLLSAFDNVYE
jgi:hypothetical protein